MSNEDKPDPRSDVEKAEAQRKTSLQVFADTLSSVILASGMMHGVTVALSVRKPENEGEVIMASNTSSVGRGRADQAAYAIIHMRHVEKGARQAITQIEQAVAEELEARHEGKVN